MIMTKIFLMMSVQNSSWQSKGEFKAMKKRCSEIGLTTLEMNRYLKYPRDCLSFAKSLGLILITSGAVHDTISAAAKQFHITPMGPMIGVMVSQEIFMDHQS
jgi:hypothetical protein